MIDRRSLIRVLLGGAALAALSPSLAPSRAWAESDPAVKTVETFYDTLLAVMKQAESLGLNGRYAKLEPAIRRAYNLPLTTRLSVGPTWEQLSPDQQKDLINAFSEFSIATYASRFDGYSGERFEVDPKPAPTNGGVIVKTKLVQSDGKPVILNYLMRQGDNGWQIIDVFLSGTISELATRRSEYSAVLRRDGPQALIDLLRRRVADLKKST